MGRAMEERERGCGWSRDRRLRGRPLPAGVGWRLGVSGAPPWPRWPSNVCRGFDSAARFALNRRGAFRFGAPAARGLPRAARWRCLTMLAAARTWLGVTDGVRASPVAPSAATAAADTTTGGGAGRRMSSAAWVPASLGCGFGTRSSRPCPVRSKDTWRDRSRSSALTSPAVPGPGVGSAWVRRPRRTERGCGCGCGCAATAGLGRGRCPAPGVAACPSCNSPKRGVRVTCALGEWRTTPRVAIMGCWVTSPWSASDGCCRCGCCGCCC